MNPAHILVTESRSFSQRAMELLSENGCILTLADLDRPGLLRAAGSADVLWVRLRHNIDKQVLDHAPRLRMIVSATTGLNHIDLEASRQRQIRVLSLRGEDRFLKTIHATAEHTLALMLALLRHLPESTQHTRQGGWNRDRFCGNELYGKTAGLVGFGRVGQMVGRYLNAFGAKVVAHDCQEKLDDCPGFVSPASLSDVLANSDIISLHVSLTARNAGMIGPHEFHRMKYGTWFINTARGELVDEWGLLQALEARHLRGAALDVLAGENSRDLSRDPLIQYARRHPNLIITPHLGGCTTESMEMTEHFMAQKLSRELNGCHAPQGIESSGKLCVESLG